MTVLVIFPDSSNQPNHDQSPPFQCPFCPTIFKYKKNIRPHILNKHPNQPVPETQRKKKKVNPLTSFPCPQCPSEFKQKFNLNRHIKQKHNPLPTATAPKKRKMIRKEHVSKKPRIDLFEDPEQIPETVENSGEDIYLENWSAIRTHHKVGPVQSFFNLRWNLDNVPPNWNEQLMPIFDLQRKRFKINFSHSFILQRQETNEQRFYHSSFNNALVQEFPSVINNRHDFRNFIDNLNNTDSLEYARQQRPDTKWTVNNIVATTFFVNPLEDFPIGSVGDLIPDSIKNNKYIFTLTKDKHHNFEYTDNLCFFRCLALHQGATTHSLQTPTKQLYSQWGYQENFEGVTLKDMEKAEELYKVNIDVFGLDEKESFVPLLRSPEKFDSTLRLLKIDHHFCYIQNINQASHSFCCAKCKKLWKVEKELRRHEDTCQGITVQMHYPGGVYTPPQSPLEKLHEHGIDVDTSFSLCHNF